MSEIPSNHRSLKTFLALLFEAPTGNGTISLVNNVTKSRESPKQKQFLRSTMNLIPSAIVRHISMSLAGGF